MPLNNVIGRPAIGGDFFNRESEQTRIWRRPANDSVLLLAPRRVGKTSLLHRLEATADHHDVRAVYVSVADRNREVDFIVKLYEAIAKLDGKAARAALRRVGRSLPRLRKLEIAKLISAEFTSDNADDWQHLADALLRVLRETEHRWIFMVDELPLFVLALLERNRERTRRFLNWFRDVRIDREIGLSVRWLLAGSTGLDTVVARERLGDTINDLAVESLGPFTQQNADLLLAELAKAHGMELCPQVREHILRRIDWLIPYHLQLLFAALRDEDIQAPSIHDADRAYQGLLHPARKAYFDYWVQRLHEELGRVDAGHALAVLAAVARDDDGSSRTVLTQLLHSRGLEDAERHRFLLDALETDGYLVSGERYVFSSPLLRDYWRARVLT